MSEKVEKGTHLDHSPQLLSHRVMHPIKHYHGAHVCKLNHISNMLTRDSGSCGVHLLAKSSSVGNINVNRLMVNLKT